MNCHVAQCCMITAVCIMRSLKKMGLLDVEDIPSCDLIRVLGPDDNPRQLVPPGLPLPLPSASPKPFSHSLLAPRHEHPPPCH